MTKLYKFHIAGLEKRQSEKDGTIYQQYYFNVVVFKSKPWQNKMFNQLIDQYLNLSKGDHLEALDVAKISADDPEWTRKIIGTEGLCEISDRISKFTGKPKTYIDHYYPIDHSIPKQKEMNLTQKEDFNDDVPW